MKRGFTLIELLVVMAIISILASILFPVFSKAMDKARATACLSNLVQIQMATMMYATDYDQQYPPEAYTQADGTPSGEPVTWATAPTGPIVNGQPKYHGMIQPYTQNTQILACPQLVGVPVGYAMNWYIEGAGAANAQKNAQKITYSDALITASQYTLQWYMYPAGMTDPDAGNATGSLGVNPSSPHNGGANYAFCDGHAKWWANTAFSVTDFNTAWNPST
jgi:prepilin-type N-terminal cleavage/methylation domain-containing protein/prepilin-type processing-associated H-X9-DG protein